MKAIILALGFVFASAQSFAEPVKTLDLGNKLKSGSVEMSDSATGELDVLIPAGDNVDAKLIKSDVDGGCKLLGVSNGGMAWTVSLQIGIAAQGESCTFKILEDGESANVTLYYSASDD